MVRHPCGRADAAAASASFLAAQPESACDGRQDTRHSSSPPEHHALSTDAVVAFDALLDFLKRNRGFDFTGYKHASLMRRIDKRMHEVGVDSYSGYRQLLETHPEEFAQLFNTVLINVTTFFRDGSPWDVLASEVLPQILARKGGDDPVRVWSAGCATGEEAYTLAMVLAETLGLEELRRRVKIYATDADEHAHTAARQGSYSAPDVEAARAALRARYCA